MTRQLISSGSAFEKSIGYSRAVVDGEWVFVSGTTGFDYAAGTISQDVGEQTRQTLRNIEAALVEADATMDDVVRTRYIITNGEDWPVVSVELGKVFGNIRPAATAIIAGLIDPRMKVEIEVTAKRQNSET